jgi:hypothetical protein
MAIKKSTRTVRKLKANKTIKNSSKGKKKTHMIDIGATRPRVTGQAGMTQNMSVTKQLANSMMQSRTKAQGLAQSLARGMGQSLA